MRAAVGQEYILAERDQGAPLDAVALPFLSARGIEVERLGPADNDPTAPPAGKLHLWIGTEVFIQIENDLAVGMGRDLQRLRAIDQRLPTRNLRRQCISGIHGVRLERPSGTIVLERLIPNVATLTQPDQPDHDISLPRRSLRDCLAEELRRLDPDDLFGEVVQNGLGALSTPASATKRSRSKA